MLAFTHRDEKANANSALKHIRKIHLTRSSVCTLLLCCRAAIDRLVFIYVTAHLVIVVWKKLRYGAV
jgi:hypothetical protein